MRSIACGLVCAAMALAAASSDAALIAYWNENNNGLSTGGFGFTPSSFPQAADQGTGSLSLASFDTTLLSSGAYQFVPSFAGTTVNAQGADPAGGSLSIQGGTSDGAGGFANNGAMIILQVPTTGYEDIMVSWAQQRTSTGFNSAAFSYSTDGVTYTPFATNTSIPSSYGVVSYDLSAIAALENIPAAYFKVTITGATSATGNNRFDNITVSGTVIPEPSTSLLALLAASSIGACAMRYRLG